MTKINIEHLENILECRILQDEDSIEFIGRFAIVKVGVISKDFYNNKHKYDTYTVIKEERDSQTNELIEYKLAGNGKYFSLPAYVEDIIRSGNRFIFKVQSCNDDETVYWKSYYLYEYDQENDCFKEIEKLSGKPKLTKNPDIVILSNSNGDQLYHLGERSFIGDRCSEIEDIDGDYFLVTNIIGTKKYGIALNNHLLFTRDKYGNKVSKVYSRNKEGFTDDEIDVPYEEIEIREIELLINKLDGVENQKGLFRRNPNNVGQ